MKKLDIKKVLLKVKEEDKEDDLDARNIKIKI